MPTIVITGGHHNSALVVAREIIHRGHKVAWIGHRHSSRGDTSDSAEYLEVTLSQIPFYDLVAGKLVFSLKEIFLFPLGLVRSFSLLKRIAPAAVLSFGGYLGGTVAIAGKVLGIPIYLHEQTITAGRANKLIGRLARRIYLTWPDSSKHFHPSRTTVVGLPLRDSLLHGQQQKYFTRRKPTLLVMGGKQGAHVLNHFVFTHLHDLLTHFNLIHQTGNSSITKDYDRAISLKDTLGSLSDCYLPLGYIGENEIGNYLRSATYYFGRSGAHICYELAVIGTKSILVPLMSTHDYEQHKNATYLAQSKQGVILTESHLTLSHFMDSIKTVAQLSSRPQLLPLNATQAIVTSLLSELK